MAMDEETKAFIRTTAETAADAVWKRYEQLHYAREGQRMAEHERDCPGRTAGRAWIGMAAIGSAILAAVISGIVMYELFGKKGG